MMNPKKNYKLHIAYDGTHYCGWQIQPNGETIQGKILEALKLLVKDHSPLIGAGRTDAGVHAQGQIAHFKTHQQLDLPLLQKALNGLLPKDIRILNICEVPDHFHSQYSAVSKIYHYNMWLEPIINPIHRHFTSWIKFPLNKSILKEAAKEFIGTHDFTSFANSANEGSASRGAVRTISRLDVIDQEGGVRLEFEADGFLYRMVRNIVGTLIEVAQQKKAIEDIKIIFLKKDRRSA